MHLLTPPSCASLSKPYPSISQTLSVYPSISQTQTHTHNARVQTQTCEHTRVHRLTHSRWPHYCSRRGGTTGTERGTTHGQLQTQTTIAKFSCSTIASPNSPRSRSISDRECVCVRERAREGVQHSLISCMCTCTGEGVEHPLLSTLSSTLSTECVCAHACSTLSQPLNYSRLGRMCVGNCAA
jgi:hypothetical protein